MDTRMAHGTRIAALAAAAWFGCAGAASAQYKPRLMQEPTPGEQFHFEAAVDTWNPTADISVASGGTGALEGVAGTPISAQSDLGFADKRLPQFHLILKPAAAHKLRLQYIPIKYESSTALGRDLVFNGQRYRAGLPVASTLDWKAYRFGYEFDFVRRPRGFGGFILEAKYTDVTVTLNSQSVTEYAHARAPIPALGGIARVYVVPAFALTGEVTGFKLPDSIDSRYAAHYVDMDFYGTINFGNNVGVQGGYRSLDMGYLMKQDTGSFVLKGIYMGVVARF